MDIENKENPPKEKKKYDKWGLIVAIGMSGLSLIVWVTTVLSRP